MTSSSSQFHIPKATCKYYFEYNITSLILDKAEHTAKITFVNTSAADVFKRKFNNKMVAASKLTVILQ